MKYLGLVLLVVLFSASTFAQTGIQGTKHNFSGATWNASTQICLPCHAPHGHYGATTRLWNHAPTVATYTTKRTDFATELGAVTETSRKCLSCHDGTVALNSFSGNTGQSMMPGTEGHGGALLGTDLSNDHPISVEYKPAALGYTGTSTSMKPVTSAGKIGSLRLTKADVNGAKYNVECSTCHTAHGATEVIGQNAPSNIPNLLRMNNNSSALCITCHNK